MTADKGQASVQFGHVTVRSPKPNGETVKANIVRSSESLQRATKAILKPGINLRTKKDVPQYFADTQDPNVFRRRLNGIVSRGRLVNGRFQVID